MDLRVDFTGVWDKDKAASDSMMEAASLMQLGTLMRSAVRLIRGIEITQTAEKFEMAVFSVLPWFKVWETFKIDGSCCSNSRRDFRKGGMKGHVAAADSAPDKLMLQLSFEDPFGGSAVDVFHLPHPDTLHVDSTITTAQGSASYRSVFHRRGSSRAAQLAGEAAHAD